MARSIRPGIPQFQRSPNQSVQALLALRQGNEAGPGGIGQRSFAGPQAGPLGFNYSGGGAAASLPTPKYGGGSGWQSSLTPAERTLLQHESGLNPLAKNPTSSAFGIWQGLTSTRNAYGAKVGVNPNTTNPVEQLAMFRRYIQDRYGNADKAWQFWQSNNPHWY